MRAFSEKISKSVETIVIVVAKVKKTYMGKGENAGDSSQNKFQFLNHINFTSSFAKALNLDESKISSFGEDKNKCSNISMDKALSRSH